MQCTRNQSSAKSRITMSRSRTSRASSWGLKSPLRSVTQRVRVRYAVMVVRLQAVMQLPGRHRQKRSSWQELKEESCQDRQVQASLMEGFQCLRLQSRLLLRSSLLQSSQHLLKFQPLSRQPWRSLCRRHHQQECPLRRPSSLQDLPMVWWQHQRRQSRMQWWQRRNSGSCWQVKV